MDQPPSGDSWATNLRTYRFAEFTLDPARETLSHEGKPLEINRRMFQVLMLLIERQGEIVPKDDFFDIVWGGRFVEDNNLTVTIAALRRVLNDSAKKARFIENVPRKGYRFVAKVEIEHEAGIEREPKRRAFLVAAAAACLLVALSVMGLSFRPFWRTRSAPKRVESVAVLPFEDRNADRSEEHTSELQSH